MLPPDMARIAIRVLGQCQKHVASLVDDIAKWGFAQFFLLTLFRKPEHTPRRSLRSPLQTHTHKHSRCRRYQRHRDVGRRRCRCPRVAAAAAAAAESSAAAFS
jgi:hypothetical protein